MWKEVVVAYFEKLSWNLPGRNKKNHEKPLRIVSIVAEIEIGHQMNGSHLDKLAQLLLSSALSLVL